MFTDVEKNWAYPGIQYCVTHGIMGGMGFTMSILIAGLAFPNPAEVMAAKCAILAGSFTAGALGVLFVRVHDAIAGRRPSE